MKLFNSSRWDSALQEYIKKFTNFEDQKDPKKNPYLFKNFASLASLNLLKLQY